MRKRQHRTKGGATLQERAEAAEIREKYKNEDIVVPLELRSPGDQLPLKKDRYVRAYMNSVVHDNDNYPVDKLVLKDKRGANYDAQYNPHDFQRLVNYVKFNPTFQTREFQVRHFRDQFGKPIPFYIRNSWQGN